MRPWLAIPPPGGLGILECGLKWLDPRPLRVGLRSVGTCHSEPWLTALGDVTWGLAISLHRSAGAGNGEFQQKRPVLRVQTY